MEHKSPLHGRSPLVPISENTYLGHAFNACIDPADMVIQDHDARILPYKRTTQRYVDPIRKKTPSRMQLLESTRGSASPWSPEILNRLPRSSSSSNSNIDSSSRKSSSSPLSFDYPRSTSHSHSPSSSSSCFSAYVTPPSTPRLKVTAYTSAQMEEDVLVVDAVTLDTPYVSAKPRFSLSDGSGSAISSGGSFSNGFSPSDFYKTELCQSLQDYGVCIYGSKCQFAHGREELRIPFHLSLRKEKSFFRDKLEDPPAQNEIKQSTQKSSRRVAMNTRTKTHDDGDVDKLEIWERVESVDPWPSKRLRRRLPVFQAICEDTNNTYRS